MSKLKERVEELKRSATQNKKFDPSEAQAPYIRKGESPLSSREYKISNLVRGMLDGDTSSAKTEMEVHKHLVQRYGITPSRGSILVPLDVGLEFPELSSQKMERTVMEEGVAGYGQEWVNPTYSKDLIQIIREKSALIDKVNTGWDFGQSNTLTIPIESSEASAVWVGEDVAFTETEWTTDQYTIAAEKVGAYVRLTNEFLEDSAIGVEAYVKDSFASKIARTVDSAIMFGTGVSPVPYGITALTGGAIATGDATQVVLSADAGNGATPDADDMQDILTAVENEGGVFRGWVMAPRTWGTVRKLQDGSGQYIVTVDYSKGVEGSLLGYDVTRSRLIPINETKGTSTDCSYIFGGDFQTIHFAKRNVLEIKVFDQLETAVKQDETWIRAKLRCGIGYSHPETLVFVDGVRP